MAAQEQQQQLDIEMKLLSLANMNIDSFVHILSLYNKRWLLSKKYFEVKALHPDQIDLIKQQIDQIEIDIKILSRLN